MELAEKIPNNVGLSEDRRLLRALETWQPSFLRWWQEAGPEGFARDEIYLRTAVSVGAEGWAHFAHVRMPDYRWGIFLAPPEPDRRIGFGDRLGEPVWQEVPGEHRATLRRIVVTQGDTEPASVEQQRRLAHTAPSQYDCRNLFQVNVEEGRHLWAMVYLLHRYFGRDGREEALALLERRSGDADRPRILTTFNEPIEDWLAFFMFTTFTDRDGKFQLLALSESAFDPLSRTTRFMLTEEAHHMFVGESGVARVVQRACELMRDDPNGDARAQGGIDLPTVQRYLNFWFSASLDLFGGEISSNAADYFASGIKGREREGEHYRDHVALDAEYELEVPEAGELVRRRVPMRNAMNEVLRDAYLRDNQRAVERWNRIIREQGVDFELRLPHRRFHRTLGLYAGLHFDPEGRPVSEAEFEAQRDGWLPSAADCVYVRSRMVPVLEPGQVAHWIAPPSRGVHGKPVDYEYVRCA
jgi:benzoyl-CoA 2,3-dioxygenase component B